MTAPLPAPDGPRVARAFARGRLEPRVFRARSRRTRPGSSIEFLSEPAVQVALLRALRRSAGAPRGLGRPALAARREGPRLPRSSSSASCRRRRCPSGSRSPSTSPSDLEAAIRGRESLPARSRRARRATSTGSSRSGAGSWRADAGTPWPLRPRRRHAAARSAAARLLLPRAGPRCVIGLFFLAADRRRVPALAHRLRHLRARRLRQRPARRPPELRARSCATRSSGRRCATRSSSCFVGGPLTLGVALGGGAPPPLEARALEGPLPDDLLRARVTTLVAVAVVWRYLYHPRFGPDRPGPRLFGIAPIDWLGDPRWAMPAIILLAVWKNFGYAMIIFVAGLQSIPESLYEAARIDGAGSLAALPADHAAAARADVPLRRRHDDDRLLPALRRAVRHDRRRQPAERDALGRPPHVQAGLPLVEHGLRGGDRRSCSFVVILALTRRPVPDPEARRSA